jgi:5'-methylthioadenosine phosphorylase
MPHMIGKVRIGIIGGTGLGEVLMPQMRPARTKTHDIDTPFGKPSAPIVSGVIDDVEMALLKRHGDGHVLNPATVPYRANIFSLKMLGCTHILASGATGSLREHIRPGDLVICDQLIDRTDGRSRTFFEKAAVHVEFADPFCPVMREWLLSAARSLTDVRVHDGGCYLCMEGPSFSTRAESLMHRQWGADVVGMTALPEARLAREAEMAYALIALPTDYDCWSQPPRGADNQSLLEEILGNLRAATDASVTLIKSALSNISILRDTASAAHDALRLAIWSDKSRIPRDEIEKLKPMWERCF